ncbi:MAG: ROK family protein [Mycoplasma sp.]|nr:ROK family protein [Mycoplasma sp.]
MKNYLIFDIGGTFVKWAITNENYEIVEQSKWPFKGKEEGKIVLIQKIKDKYHEIKSNYKIEAIGISTAGIVDPNSCQINGIAHNIKDWGGTNIKKELADLNVKNIFLENDANAATIGESTVKNLQNHKNVLMITLGTDIGGGILIDRKIYRGSNGLAGEVGFQFISNEEVRWGELCSSIGLINLVKEKTKKELTTYDILESNDQEIKSVLNHWYKMIGNGLANLLVVMNFDAIIIGGGISESNLFDINLIKENISMFLAKQPVFNETYQLYKASLGNKAAIIGMTKIINENI